MDEIPSKGGQHKGKRFRDGCSWLALVFFILGITGISFAYEYFQKEVTIMVDGREELSLKTRFQRVEEILGQGEIALGPGDIVHPSLHEPLGEESRVNINRAFPVKVFSPEEEVLAWTTRATVDQVIQRSGLELGEHDIVQPSLLSIVDPGTEIYITRVEKEYLVEEHQVPYTVIRRTNHQMDRGLSQLLQEGRDGLREDLVKVVYEDGEEVSREIVSSRMVIEKQDEIVERGERSILSRGGYNLEFERALVVTSYAYCPGTPEAGCPIDSQVGSHCTGRHNYGITASGIPAVAGTGTREDPHLIAVDPRVIPMGSTVYIEGYGYALAADRGGDIQGHVIDLLRPTHQQAVNFGIKRLKVYLLK